MDYFNDLSKYKFIDGNPDWQVYDVVATDDYMLHLLFNHGVRKMLDFSGLLDDKVYSCLREKDLFLKAHVSGDTVAWNSKIDIAPEYLWDSGVEY